MRCIDLTGHHSSGRHRPGVDSKPFEQVPEYRLEHVSPGWQANVDRGAGPEAIGRNDWVILVQAYYLTNYLRALGMNYVKPRRLAVNNAAVVG